MKSPKLYIILIVIIYLSAHQFFNPFGLVSTRFAKSLFYASSAIALVIAIFAKGRFKIQYPKVAYGILLLTLFSSTFATLYHNQPYSVSLIATMPYIFGYLLFYIFTKYQVSVSVLEKMMQILTICSAVMYIANLLSFPNKVFGESMARDEYDMSRGFARLGVPMIEIVITYFLYCINRWMVIRKKSYILWIAALLVLIFMSLTRQVIVMSIILGSLFIIRKANWYKKIAFILFCLFVSYFVLPNIPMVKTMLELSGEQVESNEYDKEDIRITAWNFYTTEFQTNKITPIIGNGIPSFGNSVWGNEVDAITDSQYGGNGCYTVDVGWAGFFWYFGIIATICLLYLFLKAIIKKKSPLMQYTTYALLFIAITSVTSGPILFYQQILSLSIIFYLAYSDSTTQINLR